MVYTKSGYGKAGFDSVFLEHEDGGHVYKENMTHCLDEENLKNHSSKIDRIVNYIMSSNGLVFVYSSYIWGGLAPLAIALEHRGFARYTKNKNKNLLSLKHSKRVKSSPRYIMLTAEQNLSIDNHKDIYDLNLQVSSGKEQGPDAIKVVLASSVAAEGVDFKCIREVHILEPWHNFSKLEQAFGRAIRHCSHQSLPDETQRNVTLFMHVAMNAKKPTQETIDLRRYRNAWNKYTRIREVSNILHENSIDHHVMGTMVVAKRVEKMIASQEKNATERERVFRAYKQNLRAEDADWTTYESYFATLDVKECKTSIALCFQGDKIAFTFEELHKILSTTMDISHTDVLWQALHDMTRLKEAFVRQGVPGYLIYRGERYIFQPTYLDRRAGVEERVGSMYEYGVQPQQYLVRIPCAFLEKENQTKVMDAETFVRMRDDNLKDFFNNKNITEAYTLKVNEIGCHDDFTLDRMTCEQQMQLLQSYMSSDENSDIRRTLRRVLELGNVIVSGKDTYFVSYDANNLTYFKWDPSENVFVTWVEAESILKPVINTILNTTKGLWGSRDLNTRIMGFMEFVHHKMEHNFKILRLDRVMEMINGGEPVKINSDGSVCKNLLNNYKETLAILDGKDFKEPQRFYKTPMITNEAEAVNKKKKIKCIDYEMFLRVAPHMTDSKGIGRGVIARTFEYMLMVLLDTKRKKKK
jgi:hypothetical protein